MATLAEATASPYKHAPKGIHLNRNVKMHIKSGAQFLFASWRDLRSHHRQELQHARRGR